MNFWRSIPAGMMIAVAIASPSLALADAPISNSRVAPPATRTIRIDYGGSIKQLPVGARVRVWLPVPQSNTHQKVKRLEATLPASGKVAIEKTYGNKILYFETTAPPSGKIEFNTPYIVRRWEVRGLSGQNKSPLTTQHRKLFLSANRKVPLKGEQLDALSKVADGKASLSLARSLYDRVDEHVRYDKSKPGYGNGDSLWVCDSRFGNCTDFHSLFISLSRSKGLPARFEIGLPLPPERGKGTIGGYHCWALFHDKDKGWVPVDISEADKHPEMKQYYFGNLTENRVTFTTGRDIQLVPSQDAPPLNYFVYPHIEVNGLEWPRDKMTKRFTFKDVEKL